MNNIVRDYLRRWAQSTRAFRLEVCETPEGKEAHLIKEQLLKAASECEIDTINQAIEIMKKGRTR